MGAAPFEFVKKQRPGCRHLPPGRVLTDIKSDRSLSLEVFLEAALSAHFFVLCFHQHG